MAVASDGGIMSAQAWELPPSDADPNSTRSAHTERASRRRVLLVEDDEDAARLMAHFLQRHYEVSLACDGMEGLSKACVAPHPDVIVSDVGMPRMDGVVMAKELKKFPATKDIPIIFLTGRTTPLDVIAGINAGARNYLMKPVSIDRLLARIRRAIGSASTSTMRMVRSSRK